MAWLVDQGWVWQLLLILAIVGLTIWLVAAYWSWSTGFLVLVGAGAVIWYARRHGGW